MQILLDPLPSDKLAHPPKPQPRLLQQLEFLVGHFQGDGSYAKGGRRFHKEAVGAWEASGQFLSLRMRGGLSSQRRPFGCARSLCDVRLECHQPPARSPRIHRWGGVVDYELAHDGRSLSFPDRPPRHQSHAKRARKILSPCETGFEERLEVDFGTGEFEAYSLVLMQRK